MILDRQTLMSDRQAITADAGSTDQIDLSPRGSGIIRDIGPGQNIPLFIQVVETFNNLTNLVVSIQVDEDPAFGTPKTVAVSAAIPLAQLVAGYKFNLDYVPRGTDERYMRIFYDITGTAPTLGRITAGISLSEGQTNG
jgi:hypothetical protein